MGILQEFKEFAVKGNAVDMAVGIIIGAAFGSVVNGLVTGIIMPPIGLLLGKVDFSNLFIDLSGKGYTTLAAATAAGVPVITWGAFVNSLIDFVIVAFVIFLIVKQINKLKKKEADKPLDPRRPTTEELLVEIRDLLKKQN